jgi:hypothetical protein
MMGPCGYNSCQVFTGAACVVVLVDGFAQHCHVIDIDADSWRQKSQAPWMQQADVGVVLRTRHNDWMDPSNWIG